jgi:hypothetical protein
MHMKIVMRWNDIMKKKNSINASCNGVETFKSSIYYKERDYRARGKKKGMYKKKCYEKQNGGSSFAMTKRFQPIFCEKKKNDSKLDNVTGLVCLFFF